MEQRHTPNAALVSSIGIQLSSKGFDVIGWCQVGQYNRAVASDWHLPTFENPQSLAICIGNSKALWPVFKEAYQGSSQLSTNANPLDTYAEISIATVMNTLDIPLQIVYAHKLDTPKVLIQQLAVSSGLAYKSDTSKLCVHPTYGPWIGLRAAVVFNIPTQKTLAISSVCDCTQGCQSNAKKVTADWKSWLAVREACPVGKHHRYSQEQILYHYTKNPNILTK